MSDVTKHDQSLVSQIPAGGIPTPTTPKAKLRRAALLTLARLAPGPTARLLARRSLYASHGFLDGLTDRGDKRFKVVQLAPDLAVLRHAPAGATGPRVLLVPGHNGHYRQFARLLRSLEKAQARVDVIVLPGHMKADHTVCSMRHTTHAILRAVAAEGPYDSMVTHCVAGNSALAALEEGLKIPRIAMISTPLDLVRLARLSGMHYGLSGPRLDRFVAELDALCTPYHLDTPWQPIAESRTEEILIAHSKEDYAAPVQDVKRFAELSDSARIALFDRAGHNTILSNKHAAAEVTAFLMAPKV
ncbi:hypothetical protein GGQ68_003339 [Sagittula marina]|uniref:Alpha/beta hydrolase n=1 Tax=Sagittula marina TaxID=943940 RepID=A0A7W6DPQ7_9RHOB|nr:hypothetical protein [Sagittula marina]MBB3986995.1 hypothetical protein [Sagittula marina]